jgi:hypothetical protein
MDFLLQPQNGISTVPQSSFQKDGFHLQQKIPLRHFSTIIVMLCNLSALALEVASESRWLTTR